MKTILKPALAALMLASINFTAAAANSNPGPVDTLIEKVGNEILPEVIAEAQASGKKPTKEALAKKFMAKLREHPEELKTAFVEECTSKEGQDKKEACKCAVEKMDMEANLSLMEKEIGNPNADLSAEKAKLDEKNNQVEIACGLSKAPVKNK